MQDIVSTLDPNFEQSLPPCFGTGLLQFLVLVFFPAPQDLLHAPKSPQSP